jgi:hypothetical protein
MSNETHPKNPKLKDVSKIENKMALSLFNILAIKLKII